MKFKYMLSLLPCTHQDNIRFRAKHFAIKDDQFFNRCSYSIFQVVQGYRRWRNVKLIFHKAAQEEVEGRSDLEIAEAGGQEDPSPPPPPGQSIAQATAYSRKFSPHCGCVVALRHVEKATFDLS
jgi:hypothetical protein